jgi:hypothetical protein
MFFDAWPIVHAIVTARIAADTLEQEVEEYMRKGEEQAQWMRRAGSIDVEARWVDDRLALPAPQEEQ